MTSYSWARSRIRNWSYWCNRNWCDNFDKYCCDVVVVVAGPFPPAGRTPRGRPRKACPSWRAPHRASAGKRPTRRTRAGSPCASRRCRRVARRTSAKCPCSTWAWRTSCDYTNNSNFGSVTSPMSRRSSAGSSIKSRIPRPVSLPKRIEAKLSQSPPSAKQPLTTPVRSKSRVRETIKLFDSQNSKISSGRPPIPVTTAPNPGVRKRPQSQKRPKSGAGEALAGK